MRLPKHGVSPEIGFRPRPFGPGRFPFGFPSESRSFLQVPRAIHRSKLRWDPLGRQRSELCRSPESQKPNRSPTPASFRFPRKRTSEGPDPDRLRSELRLRSFRGSIARRPGFRWTPLRESGVGIGPKTFTSRFFRGAPGLSFHDIPEGPSLPLSAASGTWSLRFRRNRLAGCPIDMRVQSDSRESNLPVDNEDNGDKLISINRRGRGARSAASRPIRVGNSSPAPTKKPADAGSAGFRSSSRCGA